MTLRNVRLPTDTHNSYTLVVHFYGIKIICVQPACYISMDYQLDLKSINLLYGEKQCSKLNRIAHSLRWEMGQLLGPVWSHDVFLYRDAPQRMWKAMVTIIVVLADLFKLHSSKKPKHFKVCTIEWDLRYLNYFVLFCFYIFLFCCMITTSYLYFMPFCCP